MQPVFTNSTIVRDGSNISTRAFLCDSINSKKLSWEVYTSNGTAYLLEFNRNSIIGTSIARLTDEGSTVILQAIYLGLRHHRRLHSILYVTDNSFKALRCSARGKAVEYLFNQNVHRTTTSDEGMQVGVGGGSLSRPMFVNMSTWTNELFVTRN